MSKSRIFKVNSIGSTRVTLPTKAIIERNHDHDKQSATLELDNEFILNMADQIRKEIQHDQ